MSQNLTLGETPAEGQEPLRAYHWGVAAGWLEGGEQ